MGLFLRPVTWLCCLGEAGVAAEGHEGAGLPYHIKVSHAVLLACICAQLMNMLEWKMCVDRPSNRILVSAKPQHVTLNSLVHESEVLTS